MFGVVNEKGDYMGENNFASYGFYINNKSISDDVQDMNQTNPVNDKDEIIYDMSCNSATMSIDNTYFDDSLFESMFGNSNTKNKFTVQAYLSRKEQARKHKRKRINKKWLKRFGNRTVYDLIEISNVDIDGIDDIDTTKDEPFTFNCDLNNVKVIKSGLTKIPNELSQ
jgi:hypothetical protein